MSQSYYKVLLIHQNESRFVHIWLKHQWKISFNCLQFLHLNLCKIIKPLRYWNRMDSKIICTYTLLKFSKFRHLHSKWFRSACLDIEWSLCLNNTHLSKMKQIWKSVRDLIRILENWKTQMSKRVHIWIKEASSSKF